MSAYDPQRKSLTLSPRACRDVVSFCDRIVETEYCALMFESKKASRTTEQDLPKEEKAPEAAPRRAKPPAQHAIIPANLKVTGDLVSTGDIHVEGVIHGNITCRVLTLSGQPVIKGSLKAETVRIYGTFDGNVQAKKVALTKVARMKGDISYGILEIETGAEFEGKVSRLEGT